MVRAIQGMYARRKARMRRLVFMTVFLIVAAVVVTVYYSKKGEGSSEGQVAEPEPTRQISRPAVAEREPARPIVPKEEPRFVPAPPVEVVAEPVEIIVVEQVVPDLAEIAAFADAEPNETVAGMIVEVMKLTKSNPPKFIEARDRLNELLPMSQNAQQRAFIKAQLAELSEDWLFSQMVFPEDNLCEFYKVKPGDLLSSIGKKFNVPYEILMELNKISNPQGLQVGQTLKVVQGPFHARVYRSTFTMDLYLQNTYVRSFSVGLGKPGSETPTGRWLVKVGGKLVRPTWTDPNGKTFEPDDPDYPLGSRWIGLKGIEGEALGRQGFAIHGTKDPKEIGKAGSLGCIRLFNGEAILMYNLMMSGMSLVDVVD